MMTPVLFTVPRTNGYFPHLWNDGIPELAAGLGLELRLLEAEPESPAGWCAALRGCRAAVTGWGTPRLDERTLPAESGLELVAHAAGSVADLVSPELFRRGIRVTSANALMAASVAEWSLAMTVNARLNLAQLMGGRGRPPHWEERYRCSTVRGCTVGIWGCGAIARRLLELLHPLRPGRILMCSAHLSAAEAGDLGVEIATLEQVFAESDVIHLLAGLSPENFERIGEGLLDLMRPGAALVNAGRARLIREADWRTAVAHRRFSLYQDVFYEEPPGADDPVWEVETALFTPHQAGISAVGAFVPAMLEEVAHFFRTGELAGEIHEQQSARMTSHNLA